MDIYDPYETIAKLLVPHRQPPLPAAAGDWDHLVSLAHAEGVSPLLFKAIGARDPCIAPSRIRDALAAVYRNATYAGLLYRGVRELVCRCLWERSIPIILLKGAAVAFMYYDDPVTRTMSDLDVLVQPGRLEEACRHLEKNDFRFLSGSLERELRRARSHVICVHEATGVLVELHWELKGLGARHLEAVGEIWSGARSADFAMAAMAMRPGHLIVHLCAHMTIQHKRAPLLALHDLHRVLEAIDVEEAAIACDTAARWGLSSCVSLAIRRVQQLFGTSLPPDLRVWAQRAASSTDLQARVSSLALVPGAAGMPHRRMLDLMLKQNDQPFLRYLFPTVSSVRTHLGLAADERISAATYLAFMGHRLRNAPGHVCRMWGFYRAVHRRRQAQTQGTAASLLVEEPTGTTR